MSEFNMVRFINLFVFGLTKKKVAGYGDDHDVLSSKIF